MIGNWDNNKLRVFYSELAEEKGLDPLHPQTWYQISRDDVEQRKVGCGSVGSYVLTLLQNGRATLKVYGTFPKTIAAVFPDIGLDAQSLTGNFNHLFRRY